MFDVLLSPTVAYSGNLRHLRKRSFFLPDVFAGRGATNSHSWRLSCGIFQIRIQNSNDRVEDVKNKQPVVSFLLPIHHTVGAPSFASREVTSGTQV